MNKNQWRYIPLVIWTILIILLSTRGNVQVPIGWGDMLGIDKIGHFLFYCIHTILMAWAINSKQIGNTSLLAVFLLSTALGFILEIVQFSFYPNRYFEILDILANIIGSLVGIIIFKKFLIVNF